MPINYYRLKIYYLNQVIHRDSEMRREITNSRLDCKILIKHNNILVTHIRCNVYNFTLTLV